MRDAAEDNNGTEFFHLSQGRRQEVAAGPYFLRRRLVLRWHAAHGVGDATIDQFQSVVGVRAVAALRKAKFTEGLVEQHTGVIAREGSPGAVGALQSRREPDNQHAGIERAERRYG